jgi:hypothetical protein
MSDKITLGKLFAGDPDKFISILSQYPTCVDKREYVKELNKHYNLNYSFATWSRALSLILDIKDVLHVENTILYTEISRKQLLVDKFHEYQNTDVVFKGSYNSINDTFDETSLMFVSDIHYSGDKVGLSKTLSFVEGVLKSHLELGSVKLFLTGDVIQGYLRIDDILNEQWDPVKQSVEFTQCFIQQFSKHKDKDVELILIPGNHDEIRVINGLKGVNNPTIMSYVYAILQSEGFNVTLTDEYIGSMNNNVYKVIHGHTHFGKNAIKKYNQNENYKLFHAHLHHFYVSENIVGLPSLAEPSDYEKALGIKETNRAVLLYQANDSTEVLKEVTMKGDYE